MIINKFQVVGTKLIPTTDESDLNIKSQIAISNGRDGAETLELSLDDDDRIQLEFSDKSIWFGNAETLPEIFPQVAEKKRSGEVAILPNFIHEDEKEQRGIGGIALKVLTVFGKKKITESIQQLAAKHEKKSLDNLSGLYEVHENMKLLPFSKTETTKPYFIFIHGTFSSTIGSFGDLQQSATYELMLKKYKDDSGNRLLAFQHETLTKSPLENIVTLIDQLPNNCDLHIMTHSRGGLVGDLLCLFAETKKGFTDDILEFFKKEDRINDLKQIEQIQKIVSKKNIKISKYIRVACPAYGTSLLSNKIDYFFNVMMNFASVATVGNSIVGACKELLNAIIESKSDVTVLPGLEAMNPDSVFLKALNSKAKIVAELTHPLTVISGNSQSSLSFKALKVILLRLVFQTDNDLVVNTLSMYQGARRKLKIQYFFDEGSDVSHMTYFKNDKTQKAIASVINASSFQVPGFREYAFENLNDSDRGIAGLEGGAVSKTHISGTKPIVILLPGIMGSNLEKNNRSVWINYGRMLLGELTALKIQESNIQATSLIKTSYKDLADFLDETHDVITFPFDWRKSLTEAGNQLNTYLINLLNQKVINDRKLPIKIIGHSMGGLVARELLLHHESTWNLLNNRNGFKLLLLGTPWLGSFRIPSVLSGNDGIIKMISKLDIIHSKAELVELFSKFPGILNLLPVHGSYDFSKKSTWETFQKASGLNWTIPSDATIKQFSEFQSAVKNSLATHHSEMYKNVVYVAGKDDSTPSDYTIVQNTLNIITTTEGDQSVTWASGIPSKINRDTALYYVNVSHGALSCNASIFEGIKEILLTGTTRLFDRTPDKILTASRSLKAKETDVFEINEDNAYRTILGITTKKRKIARQLPSVKLSVSNGDLQFSNYPILIGHFFNDAIISAEKAADRKLNGILTKKHGLGIYPGSIGSHLIELGEEDGFKGTVIVGLGQQEDLTVNNVAASIEKAMLSYMTNHCQNENNNKLTSPINGISCLLIGSFYGGMPILNSIRAIVNGVTNANKKIDLEFGKSVRLIDHIEFVELYEDRALQCFNTINRMIAAENEELQIEWLNRSINQLPGLRKRIMDENITDWWHRITVKLDKGEQQKDVKKLFFTSSTDAAREDNQDLYTNINLIESIIKDISEEEQWSVEKSITLFELLIPNYFKHNLHSQHNIAWIVDKYTASFPWELMQTSLDASSPICIGAKMVRQLATYDTNKVINPSKSNRALVIGDPKLDGFTRASQLPGAQKEANLVFEKLKANNFDIENALINKKKDDIMIALMKTDYKVIHLAGHGIFDPANPMQSGMLIGKQAGKDEPVLLTSKEITQMSNTPELVFVNCCYLGKMDLEAEEMMRDRYKLAANIGTQLIENGVKAVIVAGWAVDDDAALKFANVFYENILNGNNFGNSVFEARRKTYSEHGYTNTWGAYQCYGDPFYILKSSSKQKEWIPKYSVSQEVEIDLDNLRSDAELPTASVEYLSKNLELISKAANESKLTNAIVVEKQAFAYLELNNYPKAIAKFNELLNFEDANYSIKAIERYNNLLTKAAYNEIRELGENQNFEHMSQSTLKRFDKIIPNLKTLLTIGNTPERLNIIGSAYKRKAAIAFWLNMNQTEIETSLKQSIEFYNLAYQIERAKEANIDSPESAASLYCLCNKIELNCILAAYNNQEIKDAELIKTKLKQSTNKNTKKNYWEMIANANIELCLCFMNASTEKEVQTAYEKAWSTLGSDNKKQTEIEHFNLLIDFCYYFYFDKMHSILTNLKTELLKKLMPK